MKKPFHAHKRRRHRSARPSRPEVKLQGAFGHLKQKLQQAVDEWLAKRSARYTMTIPPQAARLRALLFDHAAVQSERATDDGGWLLEVDLSEATLGRLQRTPEFEFCALHAVASAMPGQRLSA